MLPAPFDSARAAAALTPLAKLAEGLRLAVQCALTTPTDLRLGAGALH